MSEYLVAVEIDPVTVDEYYESLPLHATVMHWFESELENGLELVEAVSGVVEQTRHFEIIGGQQDMFGLNNDVAVNRIENYQPVLDLHRKLYQALIPLGARHTAPQWTLDGFNAHVSLVQGEDGDERLDHGEIVEAGDVYVVRALNPEHDLLKVVASISMAIEDE